MSDLAAHTEFSAQQLWWMLSGSPDVYRTFPVPKKTGGVRLIAHPIPPLKAVQRWILRNILDALHETSSCYGFRRGSKLRDHAEQHLGANAVLSFDIENFFTSISIARVTNIFRISGYSPSTASQLARLCTFAGTLPQGAPSSPKLANLACFRMDRRLSAFAEQQGFTYTRYADDLSFSGPTPGALSKAKSFIAHIVQDSGFRLNDRKTRFLGPSRALKVTGLVLSPDKVGIGRQRLRELRACIHHFQSGADNTSVGTIQGWLDFVSDVDPDRYRMLVAYIAKLRGSSDDSPLNALRTRGPDECPPKRRRPRRTKKRVDPSGPSRRKGSRSTS